MDLTDKELTEIVEKVNDIFYDKVYEDQWLKEVFAATKIDLIKSQQTDFIALVKRGPKNYCGRSPKDAHPHIFIQEEMWELREHYLIEAFKEANVPQWIQEKWINIDNAFKKAILKNSLSDCSGRYGTDRIIDIPNPNKKRAA